MTTDVFTTALPGEALGLGNPSAEYTAQTGRTTAGGVVFLIIALACFGVGLGMSAEGDDSTRGLIIMGILGLLFLGGAIWQFALAIGNRDLCIIVLDKGLVRMKGGKADVLRWDEITSVYQQITDHYRNGIKTGTSHVYTVYLQDGSKVVYNDVIKNVQALGEAIQNEATARLLPKYAETLSSGGTLTFNRLTISQADIGTSKEIVPWHDLDSVRLNRGTITITKQGKPLGWASQTAALTPNLYVFLTLVDRIKSVR